MDKVIIIAEAGVNHNGSFEIAKQLVDVAKDSGADFVKFQTAKLNSLVSKRASMAQYQKENTGTETSQKEMLKKLLLTYDEFLKLEAYCKVRNIGFLSSPFDIESIEFLSDIVELWKIPSGEITNLPYLIKIGLTKKPVILSTGMSELEEISEAISVLKKHGTPAISLLHCNTQYPTPFEDVNLKAMLTLKKKFNLQVGYSDHTLGIEIPIAATAMGAKIIEKHFTLDKQMKGPDHRASLEPHELKEMVTAIRHIEIALGDGIKKVSSSEQLNKNIARKSIIAKKSIKKGQVLSTENITTKRPGNGISPMRWFDILGTEAIRDFEEDELICI